MKENKNLELKEEITNTFLKTVSAFSANGGLSDSVSRKIPDPLSRRFGFTWIYK